MRNFKMLVFSCFIFIFVAKELFVFNAESLVLLTFVLFIFGVVFFMREIVVDFFKSNNVELEKKIYFQRWCILKTKLHYIVLISSRGKFQFLSYPLLLILLKKPLELKAQNILQQALVARIKYEFQTLFTLENKNIAHMSLFITEELKKRLHSSVKNTGSQGTNLWAQDRLYVESLARLHSKFGGKKTLK